jgi:PAS domain S-box-containing protein
MHCPSRQTDVAWLLCGAVYSVLYVVVGSLFEQHPDGLLWFRLFALLVPPIAGVVVIVRRRQAWTGCEWLFWATITLGLMMSAVGLVGWTANAILLQRDVSWLGWYTVFALFGTISPLFALLTQPHRGSRERLAATTAVDIAGIAVMSGFLYSRFILAADVVSGEKVQPISLLALSELQQVLVFVGMTVAAVVARGLPWGPTYRRLAMGFFVNLVIVTIGHAEIWQGLYRAGFVYDIVWILPFAFYPWAAAAAPASLPVSVDDQSVEPTPSRPWVVFSAVALIPVLDLALRPVLPLGLLEGYRDLFTAITVLSVLPLLMARLAVERGGAREADEKRRLLSAAVEQADDLILITDPRGRVEHANGAFCRALGYDRSDVARMRIAQFLADESTPDLDTMAAAVSAGDVWRGTLVHRRHDNTEFFAAAAVVPLSLDKHITHFVGVERDITPDLQMRDQLIHAERLAATGQLVSGVAHELNNPLQSIIGFTELLMTEERRENVRADLQQVRSQAERAAGIVRNLLTFVRRAPVRRQPADVNDLMRSTLALRAYELKIHNIAVEETYAPDLLPISVNRGEIQQVLLNLILNAEQAMHEANGRGRLRLRTALSEGRVTINVEDDGPGISPAIAGRIFEPFFSTKETGQGTGLGLSIAIGIAEAHGGSLTLLKTPVGSCFQLVLPAVPLPIVADLALVTSV